MVSQIYTLEKAVDIAADVGNGTTCIVTDRTDPAIASEDERPLVFPSVIQQIEEVSLDGRGTEGFAVHITPKDGERESFAIGETANILPGLKIRKTDQSRIGSIYQRTLLLAGVVQALADRVTSEKSVIKATVNLHLNCPPVFFSLADRMREFAGEYEVEYNRKAYRLKIDVAHIYPEGSGAGACYMLDAWGDFAVREFAKGRTGVVDGGWRTVDTGIFQGAQLLHNTARSLTNSISGVYHLMQQWSMDEFQEAWSEQDCEVNLRRGYTILRDTKAHVSLQDWLYDLGERLADLIVGDIFAKQWNDLQDVDRVILAGGVSYLVAPFLKERYPNVVILREEFEHTKNVPYELMNATGAIRLLKAEHALSARGKR